MFNLPILSKWLRSTEVVHYLDKIEVTVQIWSAPPYARLAQLVEHETLNFGVVGSRPTVGTKNPTIGDFMKDNIMYYPAIILIFIEAGALIILIRDLIKAIKDK